MTRIQVEKFKTKVDKLLDEMDEKGYTHERIKKYQRAQSEWWKAEDLWIAHKQSKF
ncbi:MAG: hypothetical protein QGH83_10810 [Candidatus Pacebacteria bacterium]|jgi:hypothetical protein|nr:hypothetical protein [Candidatus Paceibacterota bacterium]